MNIVLWVVQGLLAAAFLMAGSNKLMRSKEQLKPMMAWVEDFSPQTLRIIGAVEVLGAIGLILPAATGILPGLTPLAAVGLVLTMLGAAATHLRRTEYPLIGVNAVLLLLALFVAYGRFVIAPLS
ncbi:MAG: DoxX family protein [Chloroflexi bacterium]|nr:DoxX family protein [Chloroflexota bacterium]